ncbi:MAG TPA: AmmeMemoRadiSam system protein B [Spirochaetota bacterium]
MFHRTMSYAGSFYPAESDQLQSMIKKYINDVSAPFGDEEIVSLVVPHAGYIYSGPVAAHAYAAVIGKGFDVAVVLAPSHRARFNGYSLITEGSYETPLGSVEIDRLIGEHLDGKPHMGFLKEIDFQEHSLEVQVPFLQYALKTFTLVPMIIGTTDYDACAAIAGEIKEALGQDERKILIVISTDLSHYHSYTSAQSIDGRFIDALSAFDELKLLDALNGDCEACGEGPLLTGMLLSRMLGAKKTRIIKYANSGDTAGDKSQVVGYVAAAFTR